MKVEYEVIFTPKKDRLGQAEEARDVTFTEDSRLSSRDEVRQKSRSMAIRNNILDEYAVRNYWTPACCEMNIIDSPWNNAGELSDWCQDRFELNGSPSAESSWHKESVEIQFEDTDSRIKAERELDKLFNGVLPIQSNANMARVTIRAKANINTSNIRQIKKIYELL